MAKTPKADLCVVRNQAYTSNKAGLIDRHNERKNEHYGNGDVDLSRTDMNIHFKRCETAYSQEFAKKLADGSISMKGLKKDGSAKIIDELIFDVNTDYFERNGGYEYAKSFFEEAYRYAVNEAGGEEYILSAVMHADERNKALSKHYGRDIYHYHLHVVYIPIVEKEVLWTKRCKDPALVGTVKEVIKQVSHSKKWASQKIKDENGKEQLLYSYSLLQDRYHDHMKNAGFIGFERGERGSDNEHLTVQEYKTQQEAERAAEYTAIAEEKQKEAAAFDVEIDSKQKIVAELGADIAKGKKQLDEMQKKTAVLKKEAATFADIDRMGEKKTFKGDIALSPADWKTVSGLAKEGVKSREIITGLKAAVDKLTMKTAELTKKLKKHEGLGITDTMKYYEAKQRAPRRLAEIVADIMRKPPEQERQQTDRNLAKKNDLSI